MVQDRLHKLTCVYRVSVYYVSSKESSRSTRFLGTPLGINRDVVEYILKLFPQGVKMSKPNDATSWKITRFLLTCGIGHRHGRTGHMVINDRPLKIHR